MSNVLGMDRTFYHGLFYLLIINLRLCVNYHYCKLKFIYLLLKLWFDFVVLQYLKPSNNNLL